MLQCFREPAANRHQCPQIRQLALFLIPMRIFSRVHVHCRQLNEVNIVSVTALDKDLSCLHVCLINVFQNLFCDGCAIYSNFTREENRTWCIESNEEQETQLKVVIVTKKRHENSGTEGFSNPRRCSSEYYNTTTTTKCSATPLPGCHDCSTSVTYTWMQNIRRVEHGVHLWELVASSYPISLYSTLPQVLSKLCWTNHCPPYYR
jgi:hypothetical protein